MGELVFEVRGPVFFSSQRSEQVKRSYLVPPPSTIIGAIEFTLTALGVKEEERKAVLDGLLECTFYYYVPAPIVRNPLLYRGIKNAGKELPPKDTPYDALTREYSVFHTLYVIVKGDDATLGRLSSLLQGVGIVRLGDTESLVSMKLTTDRFEPNGVPIEGDWDSGCKGVVEEMHNCGFYSMGYGKISLGREFKEDERCRFILYQFQGKLEVRGLSEVYFPGCEYGSEL